MPDDTAPAPAEPVQLYDSDAGRFVPVPSDGIAGAYASGKIKIPLKAPDGSLTAADPTQANDLIATGYTQPTNADVAAHQAKLDVMDEAAKHPVQAGLEAAAGGLVPGGRAALSHIAPESESIQKQNEREEANPVASTIGTIGGTTAQIAGLTLATAGLGDVAELGEGASMLSKLGRAATIGATQGITGGMSEADLGDQKYNAESLAIDAGVGGMLGIGGEAALAAGEAVVPRAVSAARRVLGSIEDKAGAVFDKAAAAIAKNPELDIAALTKSAREEALTEAMGAPVTKAGKIAAEKELNSSAAELASDVQDSLEKTADLHEQHFGNSRPEEIKQLALGHDATDGGLEKAKTAVTNLIGAADANPEAATGLMGKMQEIEGAGYNWKAPINAATKAISKLGDQLGEAQTSGEVYSALTGARRAIQQSLKYGKGLVGDEAAVAAELGQKVLSPIQDMLGRYGPEGLTKESVAAFGAGQAERNAVVNEAYTQLSADRTNLMKRLGFTDLGENGRPETSIKPSKMLALIKGEGADGELASKLGQQEAKETLTNYLESAKHYADVAAESAATARQSIPEPSELRNMLSDIQTKRAGAQELLQPSAMQSLADATSVTGIGAGGIRGALSNMGNAHALGVGAALSGHPLVGAAFEGIQRGYNAIKYPVETIRAYAQIRAAAAKTAGFVSSSVKSFLGSELRQGSEAAVAGLGARSYEESQKAFAKVQTHLQNLSANPVGAANEVAKNTAAIGEVAPQHGGELAGVAMRAHQVLSAAMPKNPAPSPLGPGFDKWHPNQTELLQFEQVQQAVTAPKSVPQSLAAGSLTPQAWQAFSQVYPSVAQDMAHQALLHVADHQDLDLTVTQKLGLSMITGMPVSNDVKPDQVAFQQQAFAGAQTPQGPGAKGGKMRAKGLDNLHAANDAATPTEARQMGKDA